MKGIRIASAAILFSMNLLHAGQEDDAMQKVKDACRKISESYSGMDKKEEVFFMDYSLKINFKDSLTDQPVLSEVKVWVNDKQFRLKSEEMELYEDKSELFAVRPKLKEIYRSDALKANHEKLVKQMMVLRDSMFSDCSVIGQAKEKIMGSVSCERITVQLSGSTRKKYNTDRIIFWISEKEKSIVRMKINYLPVPDGEYQFDPIASMEYTIIKMENTPAKEVFPGKAADSVFENGSQLRPEYLGYKIIDNRYKYNKPVKMKK